MSGSEVQDRFIHDLVHIEADAWVQQMVELFSWCKKDADGNRVISVSDIERWKRREFSEDERAAVRKSVETKWNTIIKKLSTQGSYSMSSGVAIDEG